MRKHCYTILSMLFLFFGLVSCSNEETKKQNEVASRPTAPIQNGEVRIGTQVWMTRNLNVSRYRNGDIIPQVTDAAQWANAGINATGAWCYYNNDPVNGSIYGKLYNWAAVSDPRGLAPVGYHVPSDTEWTTLTTYLGQSPGGKMKSTTLWNSPNIGATNSSGFTGFPGGLREGLAVSWAFAGSGGTGWWWSSTNSSTFGPYYRNLSSGSANIGNSRLDRTAGLSVRCIRD